MQLLLPEGGIEKPRWSVPNMQKRPSIWPRGPLQV